MRLIEELVAAVDMTASEKTIEVNGKDFTFWVTPLTAAEREKALKEAGDGAASAGRFGMSLILSKCRDQNNRPLFAPGDAARLRNDLPSAVIDKLMLAVMNAEEEVEEDEGSKSEGPKAGRSAKG